MVLLALVLFVTIFLIYHLYWKRRNLPAEEKVLDVTKHFIKKIKADSANEHTNIVSHVNVCVASIINSILFSYDFNDERIAEFEILKKILEDQVQLFQSPQLLMLIPYYKYVRHIPFLRRGFQQFFACQQTLFNFFRGQIKEHLANHDPDLDEEPRDFVGAFLKQMHKDEKEKVENSDFNMDQILSLVNDIWVAGQETTSVTVLFSVIYLIRNPKAQQKLHEELDHVIASDRLITTADRNNLTYTQAVINVSDFYNI
uniref:Cytochrome P450 n=1 Tax=Rhabditophanes sp. KR3021 TaxID=114890 RepID=A0AC35TT91_9BILA